MTTQTGAQAAAPAGWIPDDSSFGVRLMLIRNRMSWTNVSEAARACGLPAENWRLWEQGRTPSRIVTVAVAIATRTGVDLDWLLYGPNKPGRHPTDYWVRRRSAIDPRTIAQIGHGDGRRRPPKGGRAIQLPADNRPSTQDRRSATPSLVTVP